MTALLELDCIPSGMELFVAANDDQWTMIKKVIDDCDYYIVVVGGRYGTVNKDGISYTEMEYRYALEQKKPIIAFLHKDPKSLPVKKSESNTEKAKKLEEFRKLVAKKMVKYWTNPLDLGGVVSRSLIKLMKDYPSVGWVRGDLILDENTAKDMLKLQAQVKSLTSQLEATRKEAPKGAKSLAKGQDKIKINFDFEVHQEGDILSFSLEGESFKSSVTTSWDNIFSLISPLMIDEANEYKIEESLNSFIQQSTKEELMEEFPDRTLKYFKIDKEDFHTIIIQMRALGLIIKSQRSRSVKDKTTYWTLSPYGDEMMTLLRAIKSKKAKPRKT